MVVQFGLVAAALVLAVATFLPLSDSVRWWVRAPEFGRLHLAALLSAVLVAGWFVGGWAAVVAGLAAAPALGWQLGRILPYTSLVPKEMRASPAREGDVTFLALNVLMENGDHAAVAAEIARADADVVLLMETDARWVAALAPILSRYGTVLRRPLSNHYGMVFATRLKVRRAELVELTEDDTPAAFAEMEAPGGQVFRFVGLHPVPPVPGSDAAARDAQVLYAARFARDSDLPVVAMGDFNTVAWSRMARRFKAAGGYLDPRVGRGPLPSFNARSSLWRFPIDQFYVTGDVALVSYQRGPDVGSDHFPMRARVRFDAALARRLNRDPPPMPEAELRLIEARVRQHAGRLDARRAGTKRGA